MLEITTIGSLGDKLYMYFTILTKSWISSITSPHLTELSLTGLAVALGFWVVAETQPKLITHSACDGTGTPIRPFRKSSGNCAFRMKFLRNTHERSEWMLDKICVEKQTTQKQIYVRSEHVGPDHSPTHSQVNVPMPGTQTPMFSHGISAHSSISKVKRKY